MNKFEQLYNYFKSVSPNLEERTVKKILYEKAVEHNQNYKINNTIEYLKNKLKNHKNLLREIVEMEGNLQDLLDKCINDEIDSFYLTLKRGFMSEDEQVYSREITINRMNENIADVFEIKWSISKVQKIIKQENIKKEFFEIEKMNIDFNEIEYNYLNKAIHNKKPGILVSYEPFEGKPIFNFLIDGNHRITANKKKLTEYSVYKLNGLQTLKGVQHPYYAVLILIHLITVLFDNVENLTSDELNDRYNKFLTYKHVHFE